MEVIHLNEPIVGKPLYQSGRSRYPTATDVAFITDNRIVALHRCGCKAYLIDLNPTKIVHTLVTQHNGKNIQTEMIVYEKGKLYMNTYTDIMLVLVIENNQLKIIKSIQFVPGVPCHGLEARGGFLYITPSTSKLNNKEHIVKYDLEKESYTLIESPDLKLNYRLKDITFLCDDLIIILINFKAATHMIRTNHCSDGMIGLFDKDFRLLDSLQFPRAQMDSAISYNETTFYATIANDKGGFLVKGCVENNKLVKSVEYIETVDFPHGIDIHGNKLAYTSYSDSTVCIIDL